MKRKFSVTFLSLIVSFVMGLAYPVLARATSSTVIVLFDLSESTARQETRRDYLSYFDTVLDGIKGGERLIVARIVERPMDASIIDVNEGFEEFNIARHNERRFKEKQAQQKNKIRQVVQKLLSGQAKYTPILDTVYLTERLFRSFPGDKRLLVVMSDMVEESENYNFARNPLNEQKAEQVLRSLRERKRLPDLAGVKVYVAGARHKSVDQGLQIKRFWLRYFKETGASGAAENYGPELLRIAY